MKVPPAVPSFVQPEVKCSIHALLLEDIGTFVATQNQKPYRAKQIADWLYEKRVNSFAEMSDLPQALRERLGGVFVFGKLEPPGFLGSKDPPRKSPFRPGDGTFTE